MNLSNLKRLFTTDTALLALCPALAYGYAYAFEYGFASSFGIPEDLIVLSLENIFLFLATFAFFIWALGSCINLVLIFSPRINREKLRLLAPLLVLLFVFLILGLLFGPVVTWTHVAVAAGLLILIAFPYYILPLIVHRKVDGFWNKLSTQNLADAKGRPTLFTYIETLVGSELYRFAFLMFVIFPLVAFMLGVSRAERKENYLVSVSYPSMVLVKRYGDNLIFSTRTSEWPSRNAPLHFVNLKEAQNITLRREDVTQIPVEKK